MKISDRDLAYFIAELVHNAANKYGGETTLNELRVAAACYKALTHGETTSISELSESLGIPSSTVHRAATSLTEKGILQDKPHPEDGRRKVIFIAKASESTIVWDKAKVLLEQFSEETVS